MDPNTTRPTNKALKKAILGIYRGEVPDEIVLDELRSIGDAKLIEMRKALAKSMYRTVIRRATQKLFDDETGQQLKISFLQDMCRWLAADLSHECVDGEQAATYLMIEIAEEIRLSAHKSNAVSSDLLERTKS